MKLRMLDALLVIKKESAFWKKCYKDFTVTLKMLGLCNKKQIYDNVNTAEENASNFELWPWPHHVGKKCRTLHLRNQIVCCLLQ